MSLRDLQQQVADSGNKTFTDQHDKIMKEGAEHRSMLEKQEQTKLAKDMKSLQKSVKDINKNIKGGISHH